MNKPPSIPSSSNQDKNQSKKSEKLIISKNFRVILYVFLGLLFLIILLNLLFGILNPKSEKQISNIQKVENPDVNSKPQLPNTELKNEELITGDTNIDSDGINKNGNPIVDANYTNQTNETNEVNQTNESNRTNKTSDVFIFDEKWELEPLCGIMFRKHEKIEYTYDTEDVMENYCARSLNLSGLNTADIRLPEIIEIVVFNSYDGGSRREFYLDNYSEDRTGRKYIGANEINVYGHEWLKMEWEDIQSTGGLYDPKIDDYYSPEVVYLGVVGGKLVALRSEGEDGYFSYDDYIKNLLYSINVEN